MISISEYIETNLLKRGYGIWVESPSIEQLLMMRELINREIDEYFKENP
jgi:hypothetical protein